MASFWIVLATFLHSLIYVFVKWAPDNFSFFDILFVRSTYLLTVSSLLFLRRHQSKMHTANLGLHIRRIVAGAFAISANIICFRHLPLGTAQALIASSPLFIALFIRLCRPECVSSQLKLIGTIVIGFFGVVIVTCPIFQTGCESYVILALLSGLSAAIASLTMHQLGESGEPICQIVFIFASGLFIFSGLVFATTSNLSLITLFTDQTVALVGIFTVLAHIAQTLAWGYGKPLLCANLQFSALIFAPLLGVFLVGESLNIASMIGITVIFGAEFMSIRLQFFPTLVKK